VRVQPRALAQRVAAGELGVAPLLLGPVGQVVAQLAAAAHQLHLAGARAADRLVALQRLRCSRCGGVLQAGGEHECILDRLRRALREERQHRVRRIAEQRDAPLGPAVERVAVVQRPALRAAGRVDQLQHALVPARESRAQVGDVAVGRPRLETPVAGRHDRHHVDQLVGSDRVVHEVAPGPDPQRLHRAQRHLRRAVGRHQATERAQAREARIDGCRDRALHGRVDAVGADHHVGRDLGAFARAALQRERDPVGVLRHADAAPVEAELLAGQCLLQQARQIGAVRHVAMRAVQALARLAHGLHEQHAAVLPAPELPGGLQPHRELRQALRQSELVERAHHVRRHHDAGADLAQLAGLLVDHRVEAGLAQEQRGSEPAEAGADDGDARLHRTSAGRFGSKVQPGIRYCIASASSRAPSPCSL
jgi:hypothetical protein